MTQSIAAWRKAAQEQKGIPAEETDELIAAVARRWVLRLSMTVLLAAVPTVLTLFFLWQQNQISERQSQLVEQLTTEQNRLFANQNQSIVTQTNLIEQQNELVKQLTTEQNRLFENQNQTVLSQTVMFAEQNKLFEAQNQLVISQTQKVQEQIDQQTQLNNINRRAQLLATIYDRTDCEEPNKEDCPLKASPRARVEAAMAFAEIEHLAGRRPDLSLIDLSGVNYSSLVLTGTNLINAKMVSSTLKGVDLNEANLSGANLSEANLSGANLSEADLSEADLLGVNLSEADLSGVNLKGADLSNVIFGETISFEADLSEVFLSEGILTNTDLAGAYLFAAIYNSEQYTDKLGDTYAPTLWPDDFDPAAAGAIDVSQLDEGGTE